MAKKPTAEKRDDAGGAAGAPTRRRRAAKTTLKPVQSEKPAAKVTLTPAAPAKAAPKPDAPVGPTPEQIAAWKALGPERQLALREREAARLFADAAEKHRQGDLEAALEGYGKAVILNPKVADFYNNMGVALRVLGKREASVACYRRAIALRPDTSGSYSNLGNVLRELGRLEAALASHQQAIKLAPDSPEAYYNMGLVLRDLGEEDKALNFFERTLLMKPEHVECRWDRALSLLQKGDLQNGFKAYEARWELDRSPPRDYEQPLWDGSELKGKTILLHQEQGFGDMIQFVRYVPLVKARGGTVVIECQPELSSLFATVDGVDKIVNKGAPLPRFDVYAPMMSLARIFETTIDSIPAEVPYLSPPDPQAMRLPPTTGKQKKVGIAWAGKPSHKNDANRSVTFTNFVEILGMPGITVYSLQKGPRSADIKEQGCDPLILNVGPRLKDFSDTAAVMKQLDLVITVDTSVAHLAGALGVECWVAVPFAPDWRWMSERTDSPWYPSMSLFRQRRPGAWDGVFTEIRQRLRDWISS